jgi:hypothetical protein
MFKKGDGLSINVIVVATIAILVLVILSVIFMGRMSIFTKNSNDCTKQKGICMDRECEVGYTEHPSAVCYGADGKVDTYTVCCVETNI